MKLQRVLISGGNGALAHRVATVLTAQSVPVTLAGRALPTTPVARAVAVGAVGPDTDWRDALAGVSHVVHAAAMTELIAGDGENAFDAVNRLGTRRLAEQAAAAGVVRFVQISSASIMGRVSKGAPWGPQDEPRPTSAYSRSKLAGEQELAAVAGATGMETVILRPPRIVGEPLGGNLALFERLIARSVPLPFGAITNNRRDNVSPANLVALILLALTHPAATGQIFFATDDDPLSTAALAQRIGARIGRRAHLVPLPPMLLRLIVRMMPSRFLGRLTRDEMMDELVESFHLDMTDARAKLGWRALPGTLQPRDR